MRKCVGCDHELDPNTDRCDVCGSLQKAKLCEECKRRMPLEADVCNACKSYQGKRRRWLSQFGAMLAPFMPAVAILCTVCNLSYVLKIHSHTRFHLIESQTDATAIKVKVWNSGQRPSWLLAARLIFEDKRFAPVSLSFYQPSGQDCSMNLVEADKPITVCLMTDPVVFRNSENGEAYDLSYALAHVCDRKVTLQMDVEESNQPGILGAHTPREDTFNETLIDEFLEVRPWCGSHCY